MVEVFSGFFGFLKFFLDFFSLNNIFGAFLMAVVVLLFVVFLIQFILGMFS